MVENRSGRLSEDSDNNKIRVRGSKNQMLISISSQQKQLLPLICTQIVLATCISGRNKDKHTHFETHGLRQESRQQTKLPQRTKRSFEVRMKGITASSTWWSPRKLWEIENRLKMLSKVSKFSELQKASSLAVNVVNQFGGQAFPEIFTVYLYSLHDTSDICVTYFVWGFCCCCYLNKTS